MRDLSLLLKAFDLPVFGCCSSAALLQAAVALAARGTDSGRYASSYPVATEITRQTAALMITIGSL